METTTPTSSQPPVVGLNGGIRLYGFARISILASLMLTLLLEALDQTIVSTALPRIVDELQGFDRYTWVATAYLLASTMMIPIVGKLSDQFGRKWFFITGVIIFLAGSVLSGLSQTMDQLIIFRALQGLGAGIGIALAFTVVGDMFPPAKRARWQAISSGVYGFSSVVGPTAGGWLTDHGPLLGNLVTDTTRWRWIFYINLPLGIIALIALLVYLPNNISVRSNSYTGWAAIRRIDFLGALLSSSATTCLLLGLTWGSDQTYDWKSLQVIGVLSAGGVLFVSFFITERFAIEPLLPLDLFRNQIFSASLGLTLIQGSVLLPLGVYLPLYLQNVLGQTATKSGVLITPLSMSMVIGATIAGFTIAMLKRYQVLTVLSALLLGLGMFLMTQMTVMTSLLVAGRNMIITGIGLGAFFSVTTLAVQNALPRTRLGVGTGAVRYLLALGQTLGLAIVGTVVNNVIASGQSLFVAIQHGFLTMLLFCVGILLSTLFLKDIPLKSRTDVKQDVRQAPRTEKQRLREENQWLHQENATLHKEVAALQEQMLKMQDLFAQLTVRIEHLEAQMIKDSHNRRKPTSSDGSQSPVRKTRRSQSKSSKESRASEQ